jgi:hypothetical protein
MERGGDISSGSMERGNSICGRSSICGISGGSGGSGRSIDYSRTPIRGQNVHSWGGFHIKRFDHSFGSNTYMTVL